MVPVLLLQPPSFIVKTKTHDNLQRWVSPPLAAITSKIVLYSIYINKRWITISSLTERMFSNMPKNSLKHSLASLRIASFPWASASRSSNAGPQMMSGTSPVLGRWPILALRASRKPSQWGHSKIVCWTVSDLPEHCQQRGLVALFMRWRYNSKQPWPVSACVI